MGITKISTAGLNLIKRFEGLSLTAYYDCVGVITIGYGTTNADYSITGVRITKGTRCTETQALAWLQKSINAKYAPRVSKYDAKYHWNQNEFDALCSFAYNIGSIDQLTANGTRTKAVIAQKILAYNKAGGRVVNGLTDRRKREQALFLSPVKTITQPTPETTSIEGKVYNMSQLKYGDKGQQVKVLQHYLNLKLGLSLVVDGDFGTKTKNAVIKYQTSKGLTADGVCGEKTWNKLLG